MTNLTREEQRARLAEWARVSQEQPHLLLYEPNRLQDVMPVLLAFLQAPESRLAAATCMDCGINYAEFGMDVLLPRWQWLTIHPEDTGLLCALCLTRRAAKLPGAVGLHATIGIVPGGRR